MRKTLIFLGLIILSFGLTAQEKQRDIEPVEILAIGQLKTHEEGKTLHATVYDTRTASLYSFVLPNGKECGQLVDDKVYEFKLLAICSSYECEEVNFTLVDFEKSVNQSRIDVGKLREGTANKFVPEDIKINK